MRIGTHQSQGERATPWTVAASLVRAVQGLMLQLMLVLIALYQRCISPFVGANCRFTPTCSAYATTSLKKYGLIKGVLRSGWRVLRCHPFCRGGHDPP